MSNDKNNQNGDVTPVYSDERDNVFKAVLRNLNPKKFSNLIKRGTRCFKQNGAEATYREIAFRINLMIHRDVWQYRADIPLKKDLKIQANTKFDFMPLISIVVPLYNTPKKFLTQCINSCLNQSYSNFQLVLADASSSQNKQINKKIIDKINDKRITYIEILENKGISENTNIGFAQAKGDYITLLDHDDALSLNALYEVVNVINKQNADMIYSDEVVLNHNLKKLVILHFKPDFSPDTLRGCNYITHLCVFSKQLFEKVGAHLNKEFDGSQDYDLILRLSEKAKCIVHIPKVLYYWRSHALSTASGIESAKPYAIKAGEDALNAHLKRIGLDGVATAQEKLPGSFEVKYTVHGNPKITVIIPNKDHSNDLKLTIESLCKNAGYDNFEILVVENNSTEKETFDYYAQLETQNDKVKILTFNSSAEFNFSRLNNFAVEKANGEYLLLLNNDIEIISQGFLYQLLSYAQRDDVGCVGAKLLFNDYTIQHGGVILGINGTAGHSHKSHDADSAGYMYRLSTTQNYLAVTGAALMVKKSLYLKVGGLNETCFGVAYNDIDLCLQLYKLGYLNVFTPFATAYHYESKSRGYDNSGENNERFILEKDAFITKYSEFLNKNDPYYNPHFTYLYENYGYK